MPDRMAEVGAWLRKVVLRVGRIMFRFKHGGLEKRAMDQFRYLTNTTSFCASL